MAQRQDLAGKRYGRWTVIEYNAEEHKWLCRCDCGTERYISTGRLNTGRTQSCGCAHWEDMHYHPAAKIHGDSHTPLYKKWKSMKSRCFYEKNPSYPRYGGRGITVCDEWLVWENFKEWALSNGYAPELSIDRINNDGNYEPSNCRWATVREQSNNKSTCVYTTYEGQTKSLGDWARAVGVHPETFRGYARDHGVIEAIEHYRKCAWARENAEDGE